MKDSVPLRGFRSIYWFVLALLVVSCGDKETAKHTILVMDEGFDTNVSLFAEKLEGSYTVACDVDTPSGGSSSKTPLDFREAKATLWAELLQSDETCGLREGIKPKQDRFKAVSKFRSRWNDMILGRQYGDTLFQEKDFKTITDVMDSTFADPEFRFHGTATGGTIVRDNPYARLVLVETVFSGSKESENGYTCLNQDDINVLTRVLSDPDILNAYATRPLSRLRRDMDSLMNRHHVEFINESFGTTPRAVIDDLQNRNNCPPVDLRPYFAAWGGIHKEWEKGRPAFHALTLRSAGNHGVAVESSRSSFDCYERRDPFLMIGSYGPKYTRSTFSNYGGCVDLFAPGERVIAPLPGGWLYPMVGTSFSAPLVVRLASMLSGSGTDPFDAAAVRQRVISLLDGKLFIPRSSFPENATYEPGSDQTMPAMGIRSTDDESSFPSPPLDLVSIYESLELLQRLTRSRH